MTFPFKLGTCNKISVSDTFYIPIIFTNTLLNIDICTDIRIFEYSSAAIHIVNFYGCKICPKYILA